MKINNTKTVTHNLVHEQIRKADEALEKIASGSKRKISDAAMMEIAEALMSDAAVMAQGVQNANENVAMLQIADGVLQSVSQTTTHLQALEVRANSASLGEEQRRAIESEYNAQVKAMSDAISQASYNGVSLFGKNFTTSLGDREISVSIPDLDTKGLSLGNNDALEMFRKVIEDAASEIGSGMNAFTSSINSLLVARTNTLAAYSHMADADIAKSVGEFKNEELLTKNALFAQLHGNKLDKERVQSLLV